MRPVSPLWLGVLALLALLAVVPRGAAWPLDPASWSRPGSGPDLGPGLGSGLGVDSDSRLGPGTGPRIGPGLDPESGLEADTDSAIKRQTFLRLGRRPVGWVQWLNGENQANLLRLGRLYPRSARASRLPLQPTDLRSYKRYQIRLRRASAPCPPALCLSHRR